MSSPRRDRLRAELGRLRDLSGLGGRPMGQRLGVTQATISRIERGETLPAMPIVRGWLDAVVDAGVQLAAAERERILELAETLHGETQPWGELLGTDGHTQRHFLQREMLAVLTRNWQPTVVPGLLQTPEYARAVLSVGRTRNVEDAVAKRIERQQVLHDPGPRRFEFLIAEHVLRWPIGGETVLEVQRDRIVSLARLDTVDVAIVPTTAAPALAWHNFTLWTPEDGPRYVTTELVHGAQELVDEATVQLYDELWSRLWGSALHGDDATDLLLKIGG